MGFADLTHAVAHPKRPMCFSDPAADSLVAAASGVDACRTTLESAHRWILPAAAGRDDTDYEVWPLQNHAPRSSHLVLGRQGEEIVERMTVSFRSASAGWPAHGRGSIGQLHPNEPAPEDDWPHPSLGERRVAGSRVDIRLLGEVSKEQGMAATHSRMWMRSHDELPDCALAHASALWSAISRLHDSRTGKWRGPAHHALRVHGSFRADDWLRCEQWSDAPGSTTLRIWSSMGRPIATSSYVKVSNEINTGSIAPRDCESGRLASPHRTNHERLIGKGR